jgi:23S rRNA (cytidine1920-2'-O)/16S rRNA (cytidine1409-2'-O)-methyltransferase
VQRLDLELVARQLARSRAHARSLIRSRAVVLNEVVAARPSALVGRGDSVRVQADPYVSRGAQKLLGALDDLPLEVSGRALDAGASTGGFTQVLLERGCRRVYAIDVGTDQLADSLRGDPRVVPHEQTNLRQVHLGHVEGEPVDLVVADVSFISLTQLLAPLTAVTRADGTLLMMVKPQFEVGRARLGKNGVVRDRVLQRAAVDAVRVAAEACGWYPHGGAPSRLPGPAGNQEFFVLFRREHGVAQARLERALGFELDRPADGDQPRSR